MSESERDEEFRVSLDKASRRRPSKRQGAAGLSGLVSVGLLLARLLTLHSHHAGNGPDNVAYLQCIANAQSNALNPTGVANTDPFGDPAIPSTDPFGAASDPNSSGSILGDAVTECDHYPH